jgi:hypothetical protein
MAPQSQITAQVRRSLASCSSPRKTWCLNVVVDDFCHQSGHRTADSSDLVHDRFAAGLGFKRPLDRLHLPSDSSDAVEQLLFIAYGVHGHRVGPYPTYWKAS